MQPPGSASSPARGETTTITARLEGPHCRVRPRLQLHSREAWYDIQAALRGAVAAGGDPSVLCEALARARDRIRYEGRGSRRYVVSRTLLVKGLEYDHVVIDNIEELTDVINLYVALTRARKSITVIGGTRTIDVQAPEPAGDEVLVRVHASTVNRTDCAYRAARPWFMRASTGLRRPRRTILGTEYAGDVVAVGGRVTAFGLGDRVFGYCEGRFGAHAELLAVSEDSSIAAIPSGVDLDRAAASTEGAHYARSSIRRARVQSGERVLVNGATGAIGSAAVQLLAHLGAQVTAVCAAEHDELVRGLGADLVIDRFAEDFTGRPERYDVVLDAVGTSTFGRCRRILLPGGATVWTRSSRRTDTWRRGRRWATL